jgi:hypothetical protein
MLLTNVNVQHFLAKNLQINIIRNSFDTLGVLKSINFHQHIELTITTYKNDKY